MITFYAYLHWLFYSLTTDVTLVLRILNQIQKGPDKYTITKDVEVGDRFDTRYEVSFQGASPLKGVDFIVKKSTLGLTPYFFYLRDSVKGVQLELPFISRLSFFRKYIIRVLNKHTTTEKHYLDWEMELKSHFRAKFMEAENVTVEND